MVRSDPTEKIDKVGMSRSPVLPHRAGKSGVREWPSTFFHFRSSARSTNGRSISCASTRSGCFRGDAFGASANDHSRSRSSAPTRAFRGRRSRASDNNTSISAASRRSPRSRGPRSARYNNRTSLSQTSGPFLLREWGNAPRRRGTPVGQEGVEVCHGWTQGPP